MATTNLTNYLESSPPEFVIVFWISCTLLTFILCMVLGILLLQVIHNYQQHQRSRVSEQWSPVLNAVSSGISHTTPPVVRSERIYLLELWVEFRKLAHEEEGKRLDRFGQQLELEEAIKDILRPSLFSVSAKPVWQQNIALTAVKWLHSESLMRYVYEAAESDNLHVAVSACFCLTQLRAPEYEQEVVSLLFRFPEHSAYIATELSHAGSSEILQLMEPFIDDMPSSMATNFISLADKSCDKELLPLLIRRLSKSEDGREIAILVRSLGRIGNGFHRNLVAHYLKDQRYYVRIQAIKALGRIGRSGDTRLLIPFLSDREWWARYRAARAIIRLLKRDADAVEHLRQSLDDRYARDILSHAFSEMNWCAQ